MQEPLKFIHTTDFENALYEFRANINHIAELNKKVCTVGDTDASYRTLNHWAEIGLLDEHRSTESAWKKFSIKEMVLIGIYSELRKYGLPLEKILQVKRCLTELPAKKSKNIRYEPLLEFAFACCYKLKKQFYLVVHESGNASLMGFRDFSLSQAFFGHTDHLKLDFNNILARMFPSWDFAVTEETRAPHLTTDEFDLIFSIRLETQNEITIKTKDGKITHISKKFSDNDTPLHELLEEIQFGEITIKKESGKVVLKEVIKKEKVK